MKKYYVLYNPKANNGNCFECSKILKVVLNGEVNYINVLKITSYERFFSRLEQNASIVLCGGDGTINKFVNNIRGISIENDIYYYPCGTGNDFYREVSNDESNLIQINELIKNLPTVTVNDCNYNFVNGVGYGIDGFCCDEGDKLHEKNKKVNYAMIAVKGLIYKYKPTNAKITVDGKTYAFNKVWLAPTMYGKYYGGGMIPTPGQSRYNNKVSLMVFHGCGKLKSLIIFPRIFKGEHIKSTKYVEIFSGNNITVEFDKSAPIQIDGETIRNVTSYKVSI